MGLLRVFLAFSVVVWHIDDQLNVTINGYLAVICFFIISGFYMSMVLNVTYASTGIPAFYENRLLRLLPSYWVTALAVLIFWMIRNPSFIALPDFAGQPLLTIATVLANVFILGLDALVLQPSWAHTASEGMRLVGPAWSLSIELQFYLLAPFIVRRSLSVCLGILFAALALRLFCLDYDYDPWRYFYSPAVLVFFLMGHVSHRLSVFVTSDRLQRLCGYAAVLIVPIIGWWAGVNLVKDIDDARYWVFYVAFAAAVPFWFGITRKSKLDRAVGGISYPLYLVHQPLFLAVASVFGTSRNISSAATTVVVITTILAILLAICLRAFVELPVEQLRDRIRKKAVGQR